MNFDNASPTKDITPEDLDMKLALVRKNSQSHNSVIKVSDNVAFGTTNLPLIVGPNLVENREQIHEIASYAKAAGASMLRGGCFKPLTFPYRSDKYYETGERGLRWLREAADKVNLPVVTEAVDISQVSLVAQYSEMIQIGTRNMQNYGLLIEVAKTNKPVLLKRGFGASLRDWLAAAEYLMYNGNRKIVLCERGVVVPHTHRATSRFLLDLQVVPAAKEFTHLPIITDPSHASFWAPWVESLASASIAVGADGIMIETHPTPGEAAVDPLQALDKFDLERLINKCNLIAKALDKTLGSS